MKRIITALGVIISLCVIITSCGISAPNDSAESKISTPDESTAAQTTVSNTTVPETTSPAANSGGKKSDNNILLIGHRGYMGQYPESTIQAFKGAFGSGFDGIECDVWEGRNGDLLIHHDPTILRTTGKKKYIWTLSKKSRNKYPITKGDKVDRYHSTKLIIPTLEEVLEVVDKNNGYLMLHIKDIKNDRKYRLSKSGEKKIISLLKKYNLRKKTLIFGGKSYVSPFLKKGFKTGIFTSPKKKKKFLSEVLWCKRKGVNALVFANMKNLSQSGGGKYIAKHLKKKKLDFGVYKTNSGKAYRKLCRIGAWFAMSNFDIR